MNTKTVTAQTCSLSEIDSELEEAFAQLQEEREITGTIRDDNRKRCVQLFAELGKKIDRIAAYLRTHQHKAAIAAEETQRLQKGRRSAEQRVDNVKEMLTYFMDAADSTRSCSNATRNQHCRSTTGSCRRSSACIWEAFRIAC